MSDFKEKRGMSRVRRKVIYGRSVIFVCSPDDPEVSISKARGAYLDRGFHLENLKFVENISPFSPRETARSVHILHDCDGMFVCSAAADDIKCRVEIEYARFMDMAITWEDPSENIFT